MSITELKVATSTQQQECIDYLKEMLEEAKRGEILSVYGVAFRGGDRYKTFGTYTPDVHTAAGILMQVAIDKLNQG